jgi:CubicO group peptidase (beta-lactamase class C family)
MSRLAMTLALSVACSSTSHPSPSVDGAPPAPDEPDLPITDRYRGLADQIEAERTMLGAPGVAVLIMEHGQVTFAHGFGVKDHDAADPVAARTLFRIGSTTKQMTAAALLQLVASGQVGLDDSLTKWLPGLTLQPGADVASSITVRHLLTHASGLYDYLEFMGDASDAGLAAFLTGPWTQVEFMMAPAGRMWNYANPNFALAGLIAERAAGQPYRQIMHDRVWTPLGMMRTTFLPSDVIADGDYAHGWTKNSAGAMVSQAPDAYDDAAVRPAGYAFSSVYELGRFAQFLIHGNANVLADAQHVAQVSAQIDTQELSHHVQYGFGVFVDDFVELADGWHDVRVIQHGGDIYGFAADLYAVPDHDFVIVVLANTDDAHFYNSIAYALQHYASLPPAVATPADTRVDPATYPDLAGMYQDDFNVGRMNVTATASGLTVSMPDLDAAHITYTPALVPYGPDDFGFTVDGIPTELTFLRGTNGKPEYVRTRVFVARRTTTLQAHRVDADRVRRALAEVPPARPVQLRPDRARSRAP